MSQPSHPVVSERQEQIYQAAARLFSEVGYRATSMRDIASALDIKAGSLYAHIRSKEELLWEIVSRIADEFDAALFSVSPRSDSALPGSSAARLTAALEAYVTVVARNLGFSKVLFTEWRHLPPERQASIAARRDRVEQVFREILREGVASGEFVATLDVRLTAVLALSGANWLPNWYRVGGPLSPTDVADQFVALLLGGIRRGNQVET
ncbi:TetR/AcrR family transcriptional regulator [Deinococcus alpinitundrae]|uniref:TetR/AcrR family transcriptional regulator n=1 Tax=Deinococcus alpinitundrae TaxID=468913 RepID=UPI0013797FDF|nr:TetR/AcrR family transcriptional regulator [Deinococcus alpinitundrae]